MDITPHVELLAALRHQRLRLSVILGELVDNSFDAADAIAILALGVYVDGLNAAATPQRHFPEFESHNFLSNWGRVMTGLPGREPVKSKGRSA